MAQTVVNTTQPAGSPEATVADVRARLVRPIPGSRLVGWLGPATVGIIAALLRFIDLGRPFKIVFDETYYAKDALSLLTFGFERDYVEDADEQILDGKTDVFTDNEAFIVHPPLGKWLIALGIRLVGMEPTGWRLASAVAGVVAVVVVARAGRRLFRSNVLGSAAGLFVAVDGMAITVSRTAILDGILAMFVISGFACLLVDRDRARERYAEWAAARLGSGLPLGDGPILGWRPWRFAAGVLLGCAAATKWSGIFVLAIFGIMTVLWEISARRAMRTRSPEANALLRDGPLAFATMVVPAMVTYLASWTGWIASSDAFDRKWAATHPASGLASVVPDWLRGLWHYHDRMLNFHTDLNSEHTYQSEAWSWMVMRRPVSFDYQSFEPGEGGCSVSDADGCSQAMLALGNPLIWWAGSAALLVCLWLWFVRRDWRAGAILAGVFATWVPWLFFDRPTFAFYAVAIGPFVALALTFVLGLIIGDDRPPPQHRTLGILQNLFRRRDAGPSLANRRAIGVAVAGAFVLAVVVIAWFFYPIHVDQMIPFDEWQRRMWFDIWI